VSGLLVFVFCVRQLHEELVRPEPARAGASHSRESDIPRNLGTVLRTVGMGRHGSTENPVNTINNTLESVVSLLLASEIALDLDRVRDNRQHARIGTTAKVRILHESEFFKLARRCQSCPIRCSLSLVVVA
jgi:hypothetical protein